MLAFGHRFLRVSVVAACVLVPAAAASATASAPPTPVLGQSAVIQLVGGHVSFKQPGSSHSTKLRGQPATVPIGTTISAATGTVQITIASIGGAAPVSALFYKGQFAIAQSPTTGVATLTLNGPLVKCPQTGSTRASGATKGRRGSSHKPPAAPSKRTLWGDGGAGHFQTQGNYAAATVLGTVWLTTDSCAATVVGVAEGSVSVTDLVTNTSQTVTTDQALNVASSGTSSTAPFSGPATPPSWLSVVSSSNAVKLGTPYKLTATGTASGAGSAYIYENVGKPCSTTLAAETANRVAHAFGTKTLTAAGPFTLSANALAQHTGTKYYCAYLTNPAAYAQVVVKVS